MRWRCRNCGNTYTTNSATAKPSSGNCNSKEKSGDGKMKPRPHVWVKM